jgi:hypothetical protein
VESPRRAAFSRWEGSSSGHSSADVELTLEEIAMKTIWSVVGATGVVVAVGCGAGGTSGTQTGEDQNFTSSAIEACAPGLGGLSPNDPMHDVACNIHTNPCALPQEICRVTEVNGARTNFCVCDPRRMHAKSPGNPDCTATGAVCLDSKTTCMNGGGSVKRQAAGCARTQVCCEGFISSPDDPSCAGAHKSGGDCIDPDDNALPDICCT